MCVFVSSLVITEFCFREGEGEGKGGVVFAFIKKIIKRKEIDREGRWSETQRMII